MVLCKGLRTASFLMNRDYSFKQSSNETTNEDKLFDVNEESLEYFSAPSIPIGELVNLCQMSLTNEGNQSGFHSTLYSL